MPDTAPVLSRPLSFYRRATASTMMRGSHENYNVEWETPGGQIFTFSGRIFGSRAAYEACLRVNNREGPFVPPEFPGEDTNLHVRIENDVVTDQDGGRREIRTLSFHHNGGEIQLAIDIDGRNRIHYDGHIFATVLETIHWWQSQTAERSGPIPSTVVLDETRTEQTFTWEYNGTSITIPITRDSNQNYIYEGHTFSNVIELVQWYERTYPAESGPRQTTVVIDETQNIPSSLYADAPTQESFRRLHENHWVNQDGSIGSQSVPQSDSIVQFAVNPDRSISCGRWNYTGIYTFLDDMAGRLDRQRIPEARRPRAGRVLPPGYVVEATWYRHDKHVEYQGVVFQTISSFVRWIFTPVENSVVRPPIINGVAYDNFQQFIQARTTTSTVQTTDGRRFDFAPPLTPVDDAIDSVQAMASSISQAARAGVNISDAIVGLARQMDDIQTSQEPEIIPDPEQESMPIAAELIASAQVYATLAMAAAQMSGSVVTGNREEHIRDYQLYKRQSEELLRKSEEAQNGI